MNAWNKDPGIIISELKMMQASHNRYFWLVEGPSDNKFFSLRKYDDVELIISGGKRNIIKAIEQIQSDPLYKKTIGIVDSDADWLLKINHHKNIITTDPRDIEGILLRSKSLDKVLVEYGDKEKINSFQQREKISVREFIHETSTFFGKIRAVNDLSRNVCLKKLKPQIFIDEKYWSYDYKAVLDFCVHKMNICPSVEELILNINNLPNPAPWHYVRGHDAINILVGGFIKEIGSVCIDEAKLQAALRIGLEDDEYKSTNLYKNILTWREYNKIE
ncbi:DUF4435 domain-containing protein [Aeromonas bivalvium]|uniref:DUF4435 domain-containing protein n=1 Tax=Aeromonas bivalvium TaxID=440079 RepID=UPI000DD060B9|nr:DUF4435 domain-containing protein [Aeromonas bivalvium]